MEVLTNGNIPRFLFGFVKSLSYVLRALMKSDSIFCRNSVCSSRTGSGHAPKEPWLRKTTSLAKDQWRRKAEGAGLFGLLSFIAGNSFREGL